MEKITHEELREAASPLIKLLNEKMHPHAIAIVTPTGVEILSSEYAVQNIYNFIIDNE